MVSDEQKKEIKVDNSAFRDKFRFLVSANDNIICERFFKINHFNMSSLYSEELRSTVKGIVDLIQNDMKSKSRIYTWYTTTTPVKITGFKKDDTGARVNESVYVSYPERESNDNESEIITKKELEAYDICFKFEFQMAQKIEINPEDCKPIFSDYKSIYSAIWDGTVFPKEIRNSVDLSNSLAPYRGVDVKTMSFAKSLGYRMVIGKQDLIYEIIKRICDVTSGEGKKYTNSLYYGTENIISADEGKEFKLQEGRIYEYADITETGYIKSIEELDIYRSDDGRCWVQLSDDSFKEVVEYSLDPQAKYIKSWERAVKDKTEEYRRSIGYYKK